MQIMVLPLLAPFLSGVALLFLSRNQAARKLCLLSSFVQLISAAFLAYSTASGQIYTYQMGGWSAPFGISLAADFLSSSFLFCSTFVCFVCLAYFFIEQEEADQLQIKLPLLQFLFLGINLSFLTADLFNLFVAFEIMLISSYTLMSLDANKTKISQAMPYVVINLSASMLFLTFAGVIYSYAGSLNMAHLGQILFEQKNLPLTYLACGISLVVFGVKAGCFPLYFWLPKSYPILSPSLGGIYGGVLTKVGFYVLLRLFVSVFPPDLPLIHSIAVFFGGATMLLGVLGAIAQESIRGILSYHILSQMGYMILGLGLFSPLSIAGAIFFALHNIFVKSSLFLAGGVGRKMYHSDNLYKMGNLCTLTPFASAIFLIQALSLSGFPPFSGFWGKLMLTSSAIQTEHPLAASVFILTGFFTLFSMMKIWTGSFWGKKHIEPKEPVCMKLSFITSSLVVVSLLMAVFSGPLAENLIKSSKSLIEKKAYQKALLISKEAN